MDELQDRLAVDGHNTDVYDVAWARQVLAEALRRMEQRCLAAGREDTWGVFQKRFVSPILERTEPAPYEHLVREFGFRSPSQAANALTTAKRMFARSLRGVVGEYCAGEDEVEEEIRGLMEILSASDA